MVIRREAGDGCRSGRRLHTLPAYSDAPLGVAELSPYRGQEMKVAPRDVVLLLTDGALTARNARGTVFGTAVFATGSGDKPLPLFTTDLTDVLDRLDHHRPAITTDPAQPRAARPPTDLRAGPD